MSKALAEPNTLVPAPIVHDERDPEKISEEPITTIDELPNTYDNEENVKVNWFRGTLVQTLIVGLASFLAPGAYAALAATGAGGLANVSFTLNSPLMTMLSSRWKSETPQSHWHMLSSSHRLL
jgi:hypothetical protein